MSVALESLSGVDSVKVSLQKASADIQLDEGNRITLAQIRRVIRTSGYPTKDAHVTATGRIVERDGKAVLDLLNGSVLELTAKPKDAPADTVEIIGVSRVAKDTERLTIGTIGK